MNGVIADTSSSLAALGASGIRRVEEDQGIAGEMFEGDSDDVAGASEPGMRVSNGAFGLEPGGTQPLVRQSEAGAAVIVFLIVNSDRASVLKNREVFGQAIGNAGEDFGQVESRVGIMADADKEHLFIQFVHAADRTSRNVRRKRQRAGDDLGGVGSDGGEAVEVIASQDARLPPEEIGDYAEVGRCGRDAWIEKLVIVSRPGWHDERAFRAERFPQRLNQTERASIKRRTARNEVWTSRTPPGSTPKARSWAVTAAVVLIQRNGPVQIVRSAQGGGIGHGRLVEGKGAETGCEPCRCRARLES